LSFFISIAGYAQEKNNNENFNDVDYDFGTAREITIYGERPKEYDSKSIDAYVLNQINGSSSDRKQFLETNFNELKKIKAAVAKLDASYAKHHWR